MRFILDNTLRKNSNINVTIQVIVYFNLFHYELVITTATFRG